MVHTSPTPMMRSSFTSSHEKRRPKIAAMEMGPGPAQYRLPGEFAAMTVMYCVDCVHIIMWNSP